LAPVHRHTSLAAGVYIESSWHPGRDTHRGKPRCRPDEYPFCPALTAGNRQRRRAEDCTTSKLAAQSTLTGSPVRSLRRVRHSQRKCASTPATEAPEPELRDSRPVLNRLAAFQEPGRRYPARRRTCGFQRGAPPVSFGTGSCEPGQPRGDTLHETVSKPRTSLDVVPILALADPVVDNPKTRRQAATHSVTGTASP